LILAYFKRGQSWEFKGELELALEDFRCYYRRRYNDTKVVEAIQRIETKIDEKKG